VQVMLMESMRDVTFSPLVRSAVRQA